MDYSKKRLTSLCDEWVLDYPLLDKYAPILQGLPSSFTFSTLLNIPYIDDILLDIACYDEYKCSSDKICTLSDDYLNKNRSKESFLKNLVSHFYIVGLLGVKMLENYPTEWSFSNAPSISPEAIKSDVKLYVHPMFWCALAIRRS
jgi:hypothetical protein